MNLYLKLDITVYFCRVLLLALLGSAILFANIAIANDSITVYRWQRPDGTVEFSDEPRSGAEAVVVEEPMIQSSPRLFPRPQVRSDSDFSYNSLKITEPAADATFRNSEADEVTVAGVVEPKLRRRDQVFLLVDGVVTAQAKSLSFKTGRLERGRHLLQLEIRSTDERPIIQSDAVAINVHRAVARPPAGGAN